MRLLSWCIRRNVCCIPAAVIFGLFIANSQAFNLEERLPLVKSGPMGSLFGLSVAQHHVTPNPINLSQLMLLVGSPTADPPEPGKPAGSVKPGALYKCPISAAADDCQLVTLETSASSVEVNISDQWLGVTVQSEKPGGRVATCAHRYTIRRQNSIRGVIWEAELGKCFVTDRNLTPLSSFNPITPCAGRLDEKGAYSPATYGYCQAGTAVAFSNNQMEDIVYGMPGTFTWTGAIESNELSTDFIFPQNVALDKDLINRHINQNSYLGFSLSTGFLTGSTVSDGDEPNINFVAGAPRANDSGAVVIFEKHEDTKLFSVSEVLQGEMLASAFGYAVLVIDVNGDGRQDLLVGAPQFYDKDKKHGGAVYIYVNKGLGPSGKMGPTPTKVLYGEIDSAFGSAIANLGDLNMDSANDIAIGAPGANGGFGSVFIFHGNNDPNEGVHSTPAQIISGHTLNSSNATNSEVNGFGYSLSGGLDMDMNGYPDLLIGSLSDIAVLYRTRPIVNVQASVNTSTSLVSLKPESDVDTIEYSSMESGKTYRLVTFNVSVCMNYSSIPALFDESVLMNYTIVLDWTRQERGLKPRATFAPLDYTKQTKTTTLSLFPQSTRRTACSTFPIYLTNDIQDKLSPIEISLKFDVAKKDVPQSRAKRDLLSLDEYPILNKDIDNTVNVNVNISKDCGSDEICNSNLEFGAVFVEKSDPNIDWMPLVETIDNTSPDSDKFTPTLVMGMEKEIGMRIEVSNKKPGEGAHQAKLTVILPPQLEYDRLAAQKESNAHASCSIQDGNSSSVVCSLGNPFRTNGYVNIVMKFTDRGTLHLIDSFVIQMQITTSSTQPNHDIIHQYRTLVRVQAQINVSGYAARDQVRFGGEVIGESAITTPADAGLPLQHTYEVENTGTTDTDGVNIKISWPQTIANGKWLFYLLDVEVTSTSQDSSLSSLICAVPTNQTNPLQLERKPEANGLLLNREKRQAKEVSAEPVTSSGTTVTATSIATNIRCPDYEGCIEFVCRLGTVQKKQRVFIKLNAVIWNSTFLEEYYGVGMVRVYSSLHVFNDQDNIQYGDSSLLDYKVQTSILAETVIPPKTPIKWWIVAVATLAGIIVLVILILIMWRCGFFKRKREFGDFHKARYHKQASKKADESSQQMIY